MPPTPLLARQLAPRAPEERLEIAAAYLREGYYRDGWALYEARREMASHPGHALPTDAPVWTGREDIAGRRLLLWHEQGLGDTIAMLRFVPIAAQRGARILLAVRPALRRLALGITDVERVVTAGEAFEEVDFHCPLMSLPHVLGVRLATLPAAAPYLTIPAGLEERWRDRLGAKQGLRAGLVCSGDPRNGHDPVRRVPALALRPLLACPGVEFHLLQNDVRPEDEACFAAAPNVRNHVAAFSDLADVAALAANMDVVVTVCTATAHLAGALGLRTSVMLSAEPYFLWMLWREDSPWYSTLRLFRQERLGDWGSVIDNVARDILNPTSGSHNLTRNNFNFAGEAGLSHEADQRETP